MIGTNKKMAKLYLKKKNGVLVPSLPIDEETFQQWKEGEILECNIRKPRNIKFHRLIFAFFNCIFELQEKYDTLEDLIVEFKLRAGYYQEHISVKGVVIYIPKSISFEKCDEIQINKLYDKFIDIAIKYFVPLMTRKDIDNAVLTILSFS